MKLPAGTTIQSVVSLRRVRARGLHEAVGRVPSRGETPVVTCKQMGSESTIQL